MKKVKLTRSLLAAVSIVALSAVMYGCVHDGDSNEPATEMPVDTDGDGDGVADADDAFPNDPDETADSDGDGVGDNADAFPDDDTETADSDGDGVGDNADAFPDDDTETADSDGDGVGDNADPYNVANDRDNDGVADTGDDFPDDPAESRDSDGDGVGDNADDFPLDPDETADSDGDGVGDNAQRVAEAAEAKAAANKVALSKKTAIGTEAASTTTAARPFDLATPPSDLTAPGATENYVLTVKHTGSAVEATVLDGHTDYDAKNDPKFSRAASFGNGQMLVRNDGTDREIIVLHTDIEAPENVRFGATGSGYSLTVDVDTDTSAFDSYVVQAADASKLGGSRIVNSDPGTKTLAQWEPTGDNADNVFAGTLDGVAGNFRCQDSGGCTITTVDDDDNTVTLSGTLWFTPNAGATVSVQDSDYLTYGFWLDTTTKDGAITSYDTVQTFAMSSLPADTRTLATVEGMAEYEGGAAGVYVHESKNEDGALDTATSGRFTADVNLKAYFDESTLRNANTIEGTIWNFDLDGGPANSWKVDVTAGITSGFALENGSADGGGAAGSISGQFHSAAGLAETAAPSALVGEFNANFTNGTAAGAFGAREKD